MANIAKPSHQEAALALAGEAKEHGKEGSSLRT